jgi:ATP-dependent DNA helicase RecG
LYERKKPGLNLATECRYLKGVGPVRALRLAKLGIVTVEDLLTHYPRKYYDRRNFARIAELRPGEEACVSGQILSAAKKRIGPKRSMVTAAVGDDTGILQVVWFNQDYLMKQLKPGNSIVMSGELAYYRGQRQMVNPEFEVVGEDLDRDLLHAGRIVPVYPLTSGVSQRFLRGLIARTLEAAGSMVFENLPAEILEELELPPRYEAIRMMHFPEDHSRFEAALKRLKFEELFYLQLLFSLVKRRPFREGRLRFETDFSLVDRYLSRLPFELTSAQKRVIDEIKRDLTKEGGMNRLLQGDVGSGKTVVAGAALLAAVEAGFQAALMVPSELLAVQHAKTLETFFQGLDVEVTLLVGSTSPADKKRIHSRIASGDEKIVVGTHALIQEGVEFKNLGVVVIDEQHRFGVRQRAALMGGVTKPHLLVMTATPIPRSLALTAYGDLDLSVIDELPPGRAEVRTHIVPWEKRDDMLDFVLRELEGGARAYFLYPLIEETEKQDLKDALSAYEELSGGAFRKVGVGLIHGRMPFDEKQRVMEDFTEGRRRLLVSTTVIEVGMHVPEATVMVIHHPERFGLSQLHQLRGRIGRGGRRGYCFLLVGEGTAPRSRSRLEILVRNSDGFRIAEEDLRLRGPGEFFGVRQHGLPGFKLANPALDREIVELAHGSVKRMLAEDPNLENPRNLMCRKYLQSYSSFEVSLIKAG